MPPSKNISFDELSKFFHLPINQVAKELGVCATILKKICRRNGIPRWPHRKIKSLDKMISNLKMNLDKNPQEREDVVREIELLEAKKLEIIKNPDILVSKANSGNECLGKLGPKMPKMKSQRNAPYNSFQVRELLDNEEHSAPLSCFSSSATCPPIEAKKSFTAPQYVLEEQKQNEEVKRVTTPAFSAFSKVQQSNNTYPISSINLLGNGIAPRMEQHALPQTLYNPHSFVSSSSPFSIELPRPSPSNNSLPITPGVNYNFAFPPIDYNYTTGQELPALRFAGYESQQPVFKRSSSPMATMEFGFNNSFKTSNISGSNGNFPAMPSNNALPGRSLFPDWFSEEKDRIFGSLQRN